MIDKVKSTIVKYSMFEKGSTIVAAVSGGSDSMALLYILNSIKDEYGFTLIAAHINHCLRGNDADSDENFVSRKCRELGVELHIKRADIAAMAAEQGIGLEECGRNVRYGFFNSLGENVTVATAHNLSDRAETFLFNFARGSALRGLCSIPPVRENIVRPLIDCTKAEILAFCSENSVEYVTDATNADVKYSRNRIRHNVITELEKINPSFQRSARKCIDSLNEDELFLSSLADEAIKKACVSGGYDALILSKEPSPVKKRALVKIIEKEKGITAEGKFISKICGMLESSGSVQINGAVTVRVRKGVLDFPEKSEEIYKSVILEDAVNFGNSQIKSEIIYADETNNLQNVSKQTLEYYLDCDKIHGRITVRSREEGDYIELASRKCKKTLKKLFNELAIPPEKRSGTAVFADEEGVILVESAGVSQRVAVNKETKKVIKISIINR